MRIKVTESGEPPLTYAPLHGFFSELDKLFDFPLTPDLKAVAAALERELAEGSSSIFEG